MVKFLSAATGFALALAVAMGSASARTAKAVTADLDARFGLTDYWHAQYRDAGGIPVVGSAEVDDSTLNSAARTVRKMLAGLPYGTRARMRRAGMAVVIVARRVDVGAVPGVMERFGLGANGRYWAGFGATPAYPLCVATEANLADDYGNENLLVYSLATSVAELGLKPHDQSFAQDLDAAYAHALRNGRWTNSYARVSADTYWAEGVQSYFSVNRRGPRGGDGVHGAVSTRQALRRHDPKLFQLIAETFGDATL
ncbi:MAG: hypothetical protein RLZZ58_459 [Pseudomonadota bacterium]|jgi:hypothetical protein